MMRPCRMPRPVSSLSDVAPQTERADVRIRPRSASTTVPDASTWSPPTRASIATTPSSSRLASGSRSGAAASPACAIVASTLVAVTTASTPRRPTARSYAGSRSQLEKVVPLRIALRIAALAPTPSTSSSARPAPPPGRAPRGARAVAWPRSPRCWPRSAGCCSCSPRVTRRRSWSASRHRPGWPSWTGASGPPRRAPGRSRPSTPTARSARPCAWAARRRGSPPARTGCG